MPKIFYKEKIISYVISIPIGMLIILCMIGVGFIIADENANQLILLGLLGSLIVLILLFYHLYKLEIIVDESHLHLRLGKGNLGKRFLLSEIEIDSFSEKDYVVLWYRLEI
ncbi:hypothetical protein ACFSO9_09210 [Mesonia maritima]|uniref:hypothetical protein n=1 Tax=Mesonia maritima TaxID=1793873 RepID=UPI003625F333